MLKQDKITNKLIMCVVSFLTIVLLGSFVVSFKVIDLCYLIFFYGFMFVYRIY